MLFGGQNERLAFLYLFSCDTVALATGSAPASCLLLLRGRYTVVVQRQSLMWHLVALLAAAQDIDTRSDDKIILLPQMIDGIVADHMQGSEQSSMPEIALRSTTVTLM